MVDPCPSSSFIDQNYQFENLTYTLGAPEIRVSFTLTEMVRLDTKVNCGHYEIEFVSTNGKELLSDILELEIEDSDQYFVNDLSPAWRDANSPSGLTTF